MTASLVAAPADSIFERCWWLYALYRERFFTDHTEAIAAALQPMLRAQPACRLIELGCGPGFYARRLAARFPNLHVIGIDTSDHLLACARLKAERAHLRNCRFLRADAESLADFPESAEAVIVSRLLLILSRPELTLNAIFQALCPGGICFVAEPISTFGATMPLWFMRFVAPNLAKAQDGAKSVRCEVLSRAQFSTLIEAQPWQKAEIWRDDHYQYALCEKPL